MELIKKHHEELKKACIISQVNELFVFGSILDESFTIDSDIDFVVSLISEDPIEYGENYFLLKFELERIFKRKIDLLEQKGFQNKIFKQLVDQQKVLVYERSHQGLA